jgi:hypothetical protein
MWKAPLLRGASLFFYRPFAPLWTAPGSFRVPVLFTPAAVEAPEVLAEFAGILEPAFPVV